MKISLKKFLLCFASIGLIFVANHPAGAQTPNANLLRASNDFSNPAWLSKKTLITKSEVSDPDGKKSAFRLAIEDGGYLLQVIKTAQPNHQYLFSVWIKSATSSPQTVKLAGENNTPKPIQESKSFEITDQWKRVFIPFSCSAEGNFNFRFSVRGGADVLVWHPQVEDITGKASAEPSPYQEAL